ncbi:hypothetical protein H4S07_000178 [Coemansia furcata]|uniref:Uncharacterized protein n=1 Tax=Coemansia furcata TaxID=417177 RepID=A0ACC1LRT9_9FUNG|nr:hypothetical protein H4S07_000178 [Coemansia furcata]
MATKAEKEREARIAARKAEAEKKTKEAKAKIESLKKRLMSKDSQSITLGARVNMFKHGVIVEVVNKIQAKLAQEAGFTAICPYDFPQPLNALGNPVTSDPRVIRDMINSVLIPVMAKVRVGHIIEAKMAAYLGANIIDESDYTTKLTSKHMLKEEFGVPFMCSVTNLEDCFRRIEEGAMMLRNREPDMKFFAHTISAIKVIFNDLKKLGVDAAAKKLMVDKFENKVTLAMIDKAIADNALPVPFYGYGSVCTPTDVAMLRKMGCGAIVSNIAFRADNPRRRLKMLVQASTSYKDPAKMAELSTGTNERAP